MHCLIPELPRAMRRAFVVAIVTIAVSGVVPLIANFGSCEGMPCCHKSGTAIAATAGCCGPATCIKEEQALRAGTATLSVLATPILAVHNEIPAPIRIADPLSVSHPPPTSQRLSALSILLI